MDVNERSGSVNAVRLTRTDRGECVHPRIPGEAFLPRNKLTRGGGLLCDRDPGQRRGMTAQTLRQIRRILQSGKKPEGGIQRNDGDETTSGIGLERPSKTPAYLRGRVWAVGIRALGRHDI